MPLDVLCSYVSFGWKRHRLSHTLGSVVGGGGGGGGGDDPQVGLGKHFASPKKKETPKAKGRDITREW